MRPIARFGNLEDTRILRGGRISRPVLGAQSVIESKIDDTTPDAPSGLTVSSDYIGGDVLIIASWNAVPNANSYEVQFKRASASVWSSGYTSDTTTNLGPVQAQKLYEVKVRALSDRRYVMGPFSSIETVTTTSDENAVVPSNILVPALDLYPN